MPGWMRRAAVCAAMAVAASSVSTPPASADPREVRPVTRAELGPSWRPGCPVGPEDLRAVTVRYLDYDNRPQAGELIVHRSVVDDIRTAFDKAYTRGLRIFTIASAAAAYHDGMSGLDADQVLMESNITSGFNCRKTLTGGWSAHAYGKAVDINPAQNPYLTPMGWLPDRRDRKRDTSRGKLTARTEPVITLMRRGWVWGGSWQRPDYQHLEVR